jgi:Tol biopolymer transport system component
MHLRRAVLVSCCLLAAGAPAAAAALPDGRAYELVSPYDTGQGDLLNAVGFPDGEHAYFVSLGLFAGHPSGVMGNYVAERTPQGWVTTPTGPADDRDRTYQVVDAADDASRLFLSTLDGLLPIAASKFQQLDADGTRTDLLSFPVDMGGTTNWAGRSGDGTRAFAHSGDDPTDEYDDIAFPDPISQLYDVTGGDIELVGRDEAGDPLECGAASAAGVNGGLGRSLGQNAISRDGRTIAYITPGTAFNPGCDAPPPDTLFVARDGEVAEISSPEAPEPNAPATFLGMDPAGTRVWFLTTAALDPADANGAGDIYVHDVATGGLERLTADSGDDDAGVTSGLVSADGSHVYFTAANAIGGAGQDGAENLFVWTDQDGIRLVVTAPITPLGTNNMYPGGGSFATPDGRHLLFWSSAQLTEHDNTTAGGSTVQQVFQYREPTGDIVCITCNVDPASDPIDSFARALGGSPAGGVPGQRVQSDDGRHVIFVTPAPMLPEDHNTTLDLYERGYDGRLSLISSGRAIDDVIPAGMSADGRDIFFATSERLVPGLDQDNVKLYDARIDGGLPAPETPVPPDCTGDECQGTPTPPAPPVVPGSATLDGPGNVSEAARALRVSRIGAKARRRASRTGRLRISAKVAQAGAVTARLTARLPKRGRRTIASASTTAERPGTVRLTLRISRPATRALAKRRLQATLRVTAPGADPKSRDVALPRR